ncbi:MAG TPA: sigma-70 family RNA polymerase sigma factor [Promineifilum sp.]
MPKQEMATLSDGVLLDHLMQGDSASFDELFLRHYNGIYGLLFRLIGNREEAEDVAQEVFMKLHSVVDHGRWKQDNDNVFGWLYRVAMNMGNNHIRARNRLWQRNTFLVPESEPGAEVDRQVELLEERTLVRETLGRLPERQALLLLLRQMDYSYAECAAICDIAPGSVGTLLARAAEAFRQEFQMVTNPRATKHE